MAPRRMTAEQVAAANVLRDMFVKGTLTGEEKSADIRKENISTFKYFDIPKFRKLFMELKKEYCLPKRGSVVSTRGVDLVPKCSDALYVILGNDAPGPKSDMQIGEDGSASELLFGRMDFMPLHVIAPSTCNITLKSKLSVCVVLQSGVFPRHVKVDVEDNLLTVKIAWPNALSNPNIMHREWFLNPNPDIVSSAIHKKLAFEMALKQLRQKRSDILESTATIRLPSPVKASSLKESYLGFKDESDSETVPCNEQLLYVDTDVEEEDYDDSTQKKAIINVQRSRPRASENITNDRASTN